MTYASLNWSPAPSLVGVAFWACIGGILVLIGLWMEGAPDEKEFRDIDAFWRHKSKAKWGWRILIVGILVEIGTAGTLTVREELEMRSTAKQAEELRKGNADRHISEKQRKDFINVLKNSPKGPVMTGSRHPNSETQAYFYEIVSMLTNAGFPLESQANYSGNLTQFPAGSSIGIFVDRLNDAPSYTWNLFRAFQSIGLNPSGFTNVAGRTYSFDEGNPPSNKVLILVVEKN
jgi:hypothetical protein